MVSVPTGDFSFIYETYLDDRLMIAGFRPHRGLFFYLLQRKCNNE